MHTPLTPDLVELKRLYEVSTKGEWSACLVKDNDGKPYATMYQTWAFVEPSVCGLWAGEGKDRNDLDFIVAAHNAFPALMAAAEERDRLAKRVTELEAKYESKPVVCPACESDDTSPYEGGGYVCFNCQKDFILTKGDR